MRAVGLAVLIAVAPLAACGEQSPPRGPGLSGEEVHWVSDYAAWTGDFGDAMLSEGRARADTLGGGSGLERYAEATEDLRDCVSSLEPLDDPPPRLVPTRAALRALCEDVVSATGRLGRARDPAMRMDAFVGMEQAAGRAVLEMQQIDSQLDELTLARGKLRRLGGAARTSRIEPVLTSIAGRIADGRAIEVRCWSDADWRRVLDEESALTRGAMSVDTVGAFAQPLTGTVHLQQAQCGPVVGLLRGAELPGGDDLYDLAAAVGTLSHEIQHIVSPTAGEAATECAAVQHNAEVAAALGAASPDAQEIAQYYWERIYPDEGEDYRSSECRAGGDLDLRPETPSFPTG